MELNPDPTVVLHVCLGVGHLIPMVELAKLFVRRGIPVVIAVPTRPASTADFFAASSSAVAGIAAANPSISFHHLPPPDYPSPDPDPFLQMLDVLRLTVPLLLAFLRSLPSVAALVLDLFCIDSLDAASEAGVPAYIYYTSSAGDLAAFLHLPHHFATTEGNFKDMGKALLRFPGVPPIPASDMPHTVLDRATRACTARIGHYGRIPEARGVLVNTYEWLEARYDEMKARVVMEGYDKALVKAEEVEKKVRLVLDSEEGEKLRERLALAKERAAKAMADSGSSQTAFAEFLNDLKLTVTE